jgi:hypothetical protein
MPPSDLDITRAAHLLIQQHGDEATAKARQKVDEMRRMDDADGARPWSRLVARQLGNARCSRPARMRQRQCCGMQTRWSRRSRPALPRSRRQRRRLRPSRVEVT